MTKEKGTAQCHAFQSGILLFLTSRPQYQLLHRSSFPETEIPAGPEHLLSALAGMKKGPLARSSVCFLFRQHNDSTVKIPIVNQLFSIFLIDSHLLQIYGAFLH